MDANWILIIFAVIMGVLNCIFLDANKFFVANVFTVDADWLLNVIFMGSKYDAFYCTAFFKVNCMVLIKTFC